MTQQSRNRSVWARLHKITGASALLLISAFWSASVISEALGGIEDVRWVKQSIAYGLLLLIPLMAATGGTGQALIGTNRARAPGGLVGAKMQRMRIAALIGVVCLVPSALFLAWKAQGGAFDTAFYAVQTVELVAGAVNISLLVRNMRDGLRMTARRRRAA
ncbi:MAG: hypothetical protein MRY63_06290 [Neomegalonema sp.]|nr:hypothetical protein [Neomegalonema sp.]